MQRRIGGLLALLLVAVLQWITSPAAASSLTSTASSSPSSSPSAGFNESLLLRPLHDGKSMMHWQFEVRTEGNGGNERKERRACTLLVRRGGDRLA
jgi:hypothetical protein